MSDSTQTPTPTTLVPTDIDRINRALVAFHKSEDAHSAEAIRLLITEAVKLAIVVQPVRADFWSREQQTNAKAKVPTASRMVDLMGDRFRGDKADMELALSIPCGDALNPYDPTKVPTEAATNKLLVSYRARCTSTRDDDGVARAATIPTWQGFRSFLAQSAAYYRSAGSAKFDAKSGMLTDGAKKARDTTADAAATNAGTIIASPFYETETAAHINDPIEAWASVRCIQHDAVASLAKLAQGMSPAQIKEATKRYHDLLKRAATPAITPAATVTA
jgi:hypothetical protein